MKYRWLTIFYDGRTYVETHHCRTLAGALAVLLSNSGRRCRRCVCRAHDSLKGNRNLTQ